MTFWLDSHLPPKLADWLGSRYKIVVKPLREIGLREEVDNVLIAAARRIASIVVLTKDGEFVQNVKKSGTSPQMIWLKCGNLTNLELQMWLSTVFDDALAKIMA